MTKTETLMQEQLIKQEVAKAKKEIVKDTLLWLIDNAWKYCDTPSLLIEGYWIAANTDFKEIC